MDDIRSKHIKKSVTLLHFFYIKYIYFILLIAETGAIFNAFGYIIQLVNRFDMTFCIYIMIGEMK